MPMLLISARQSEPFVKNFYSLDADLIGHQKMFLCVCELCDLEPTMKDS